MSKYIRISNILVYAVSKWELSIVLVFSMIWDMRRQTAYQILDDMLTVSVAGLCEKTSFLYNFSIDGFNDSPAGFYFF